MIVDWSHISVNNHFLSYLLLQNNIVVPNPSNIPFSKIHFLLNIQQLNMNVKSQCEFAGKVNTLINCSSELCYCVLGNGYIRKHTFKVLSHRDRPALTSLYSLCDLCSPLRVPDNQFGNHCTNAYKNQERQRVCGEIHSFYLTESSSRSFLPLTILTYCYFCQTI